MSRRGVLKGLSATGATAAAGGAGLLAMSGTAAASSFTFTAERVEADYADGDVKAVYIEPTGDVTWEDFDEEIVAMDLTLKSRVQSADGESTLDGWKEVWSGTAGDDEDIENPGKSGGHSGRIGEKHVLYEGAETDHFDAAPDGTTNHTEIDVQLTVELLNSEGERADPSEKAVLSDTASFTVSATNRPASAGGSAEAGTGME